MRVLDAKQIADFLTLFRGVLAVALVWVGVSQGAEGLPLAVTLLLLSWTSDSLDGPIARHSNRHSSTWIGLRDLEFDMAVSGGLLLYMVLANLVTLPVAGGYMLVWILIFWRWGVARSLGMLVQAPIYGWFISVAIRDARTSGQWLVVWVLGSVIISWPRFPKMIVPEFLRGIRSVWGERRDSDH